MKLALIGYGKMGQSIERIALNRGHTITARIDPLIDSQNNAALTLLQDVDVCVDFSNGNAVSDHVDLCIKANKPLIIGTTGWYDELPKIKEKVEKSKIGALYSPNFSLGVNLFLHVIQESAKCFNPFDNYDVSGFELHHNQKADSPSGTAKAIADTLLKELKRKKHALYDTVNRKVEKDELQFTSLRCGSIPGTHTVIFDSPNDSITLTHTARNREGFAEGAVIAAEWLFGKTGFFTMEDFFESLKK